MSADTSVLKLKIRSVVFLRKDANRQTNRQTNAGHYITSLVEVIILQFVQKAASFLIIQQIAN